MEPIVGVKCYGNDWRDVHGLSTRDAAAWFARNDVDWALIKNYDASFSEQLRHHGVKHFETVVMFHDPVAFKADPGLRPVDAAGRTFEPYGWYYGICPSNLDYVRAKAVQLADGPRPDGLFVSFIRFPGFWELWMPSLTRAGITEYCFCDRCLRRFQEDTGLVLSGTRAAQVGVLQNELRPQWTAWKCGVIASVVRAIRDAVPGIPVLLNGFGLGSTDFGNAVEHVLAQRFHDLDAVTDFYELMFYFQIQRRDPAVWIPGRLAEVRRQSAKPVLACLQASPEYLSPEYAAGSRATEITGGQWRSALKTVAAAGADGVAVYSWRDLLVDEARGGSRVKDLRDYRWGTLKPGFISQ